MFRLNICFLYCYLLILCLVLIKKASVCQVEQSVAVSKHLMFMIGFFFGFTQGDNPFYGFQKLHTVPL